MLDDIRASIRLDDWNEAWRLAVRLNGSIIERSPGRVSRTWSCSTWNSWPAATRFRVDRCCRLARTALAAGNLEKRALCQRSAAESKRGVSGGPATPFTREHLLGGWRCAAEKWKMPSATCCLPARPPAHVAGGAGTNMALARDLLEHGESAAVLQYRRGMRILLGWKPRKAGRMDGSHSRRAEAGLRSQRDVLVQGLSAT